MTTVHGVSTERMEIDGDIPQGSKLGPIAFIIKINQLPSSTNCNSAETTKQDGIDKGETVMFMDFIQKKNVTASLRISILSVGTSFSVN